MLVQAAFRLISTRPCPTECVAFCGWETCTSAKASYSAGFDSAVPSRRYFGNVDATPCSFGAASPPNAAPKQDSTRRVGAGQADGENGGRLGMRSRLEGGTSESPRTALKKQTRVTVNPDCLDQCLLHSQTKFRIPPPRSETKPPHCRPILEKRLFQ